MSDKKSDHTANENEGPGAPAGEPPENASADAAPPAQDGAEASGWAKGDLETLKQENEDLRDRLLRAAAEMENLRRRTERDKADTAKFAISNFARDVLTVGDNITRAIDHVPEEAAEEDPALKSFLEGVRVTERELHNVLERHGITRLDPKGERFDPNKHQAMFEVNDANVAEGTIVDVIQQGYVIAERVLRPALVGIAKGGPKQPRPEAEPPQAANRDASRANPDEPESAPSGPEKREAKTRKKVGGKVDKSA